MMAMGETRTDAARVGFDGSVKLQFHGADVSSDGGLFPYRDLDEALALPGNEVLYRHIAHLLTRPVGRPPNKPQRFYHSFQYQAQSWDHPRRVVAKVEWHQDELLPRVGFIVTNLGGGAKAVMNFYNQRSPAEQWIKEGKNAVNWTRLSCQSFEANQVRLQLHVLAYNLANFLRRLALPPRVGHWTLTTLREKLIKIGAKVVRHARYVTFQMAEVAVPRILYREILRRIARLRELAMTPPG
jgi:hypothetical protein